MAYRLLLVAALTACRDTPPSAADAAVDGATILDGRSADAPSPDASASRVMEVCATSCAKLETCMSFPTCVSECVEDVQQAGCNAQELDAIAACGSASCDTIIDCLTSIACLMQ